MKRTVLISGLVALLFNFNSTSVSAQTLPRETMMDPYFQVSKITTRLVSAEEAPAITNEFLQLEQDILPSILPALLPQQSMGALDIVDLAFKAWDIIKSGTPVVSAQYKNVTALPNIANQRWEALTGWKSERTLVFATSVVNFFGVKTVDLEYKVKLLYGGSVRGKGQYIASARVVPTKVDVLWGYNLDVSVEVPSILNIASNDDPLASINMDVTYKISTMMRSYSESNNYVLQGNGLMKGDGKVLFEASSR